MKYKLRQEISHDESCGIELLKNKGSGECRILFGHR